MLHAVNELRTSSVHITPGRTQCVSITNFQVMAARGRRFAARRAAEIIANWSSDENDDEIDDGLSDYDDADSEPVLEDESDDTNDDSDTEERNNPMEGVQEVISCNGQRWKFEPSVQRRRIPSHNILRNPQ